MKGIKESSSLEIAQNTCSQNCLKTEHKIVAFYTEIGFTQALRALSYATMRDIVQAQSGYRVTF